MFVGLRAVVRLFGVGLDARLFPIVGLGLVERSGVSWRTFRTVNRTLVVNRTNLLSHCEESAVVMTRMRHSPAPFVHLIARLHVLKPVLSRTTGSNVPYGPDRTDLHWLTGAGQPRGLLCSDMIGV